MATPKVINELSHREVLSFLHGIDQSFFKEVARNADGTVARVTIWTTSGKTQKVREVIYTRTGALITGVTKTQYDLSGVLAATITLAVGRDGSNRVISSTGSRS